jgi:hypothetical protein
METKERIIEAARTKSEEAKKKDRELEESIAKKKREEMGRMRRERTGETSGMERTLGSEQGLLEGPKIHFGIVKGLTILVNFNDVKSNVSRQDVDELLNG